MMRDLLYLAQSTVFKKIFLYLSTYTCLLPYTVVLNRQQYNSFPLGVTWIFFWKWLNTTLSCKTQTLSFTERWTEESRKKLIKKNQVLWNMWKWWVWVFSWEKWSMATCWSSRRGQLTVLVGAQWSKGTE